MKSIAYLSVAAGLITILAAGSVSATPIVPTLTLDDGITQLVIADNSLLDSDKTVGIVAFTGALGEWDLSISNGFGQMGPDAPTMHLSSIDMLILGSGSLMIKLSETITQPWTFPVARTSAGGVFGTGGSTGTFKTLINWNPYGVMDFDTSKGRAFSGDEIFSYLPTGNDLVELTAMITSPYTGIGVTSFDYAIAPEPVPEPGTFALFGVAGLALAVFSKRRTSSVPG